MNYIDDFQSENGNDVVFDEIFLVWCGQNDVNKVLLLEKNEPIKASKKDNAQKNVGQISASIGQKFGQSERINSRFARSTIP